MNIELGFLIVYTQRSGDMETEWNDFSENKYQSGRKKYSFKMAFVKAPIISNCISFLLAILTYQYCAVIARYFRTLRELFSINPIQGYHSFYCIKFRYDYQNLNANINKIKTTFFTVKNIITWSRVWSGVWWRGIRKKWQLSNLLFGSTFLITFIS